MTQPQMTSAKASTTKAIKYKTPPAPLDKLVDAPFSPGISLSPDQRWMLFLHHQTLPTIEDLAEKELRLAGMRVNPLNNAPSRNWYYVNLTLRAVNSQSEIQIKGLPPKPRISHINWSPDGKKLAFTHSGKREVTLWIVDIESATARQIKGLRINKAYGYPFDWLSDSQTLICKTIPGQRKEPPADSEVPSGPLVLENLGSKTPARTYQDLLRNSHDAALFEYYFTSQLTRVQLSGEIVTLGEPGLLKFAEPSPDGQYILVHRIHRPFSYLLPASRFPQKIEVWSRTGELVYQVADLPLADKIPIGFDAVRSGRRNVSWRTDKPATLTWIEALDGGNPEENLPQRDRLMTLAAPFQNQPQKLLDLTFRYRYIYWGDDDLALVYEGWHKTRQTRVWRIWPGDLRSKPKLVFEYSSEDRYAHPGAPVTEWTPEGRSVLLARNQNQTLYFKGMGASPEGNLPFLDQLDLKTGQTQRVWQSRSDAYERIIKVLDFDKPKVILRRETQNEPPNYYLRTLRSGQEKQLTHFPHPMPELANITKEQIEYTRKDGVKLNASLYLPAGYKLSDGPLPTVIWAYPREFKSAEAAGQMQGSNHEFIRLGLWSPLVFLTQGYAVVDNPTMPIIGEGDAEPNDSYIEQLKANAEAVVEAVVNRGVADPLRLAIGGHSYGAFMTVNLLAHTDLFRAGIARSGAYNRTLTPFGFQSEERTLWEAPETYFQMSPLMFADRIKEPLLLIHGEEDNNPGTLPMQSHYFYQALKGLGGQVRLVMLPHESHAYRARESINHMLWEMTRWLDLHVKQAPRQP